MVSTRVLIARKDVNIIIFTHAIFFSILVNSQPKVRLTMVSTRVLIARKDVNIIIFTHA